MISGAVGPGDHALSKSSIWIVSILGGQPRKLRDGAFGAEIAPDDSAIAYMNEQGIALAGPDGNDPRQLVTRGPRELTGSPTWSADGRRVVYRRAEWGDRGLVTSIESRGLADEASVVLVRDARSTGRLKDDPRVWNEDFRMLGDRLVYSRDEPAPRNRDQNLWELPVEPRTGQPDGEPRRLTDWVGFRIRSLSATADGSKLVLGNDGTQQDVWVGELLDGGHRLVDPRRLTLDDRDDEPSCWMPDSSAIVFESDRYGRDDLLVQGLEDAAARDLVVGAGEHGGARATPDGRFLLYWDVRRGADGPVESVRLLRMPVEGGPTEPVWNSDRLALVDCATEPDGPCLLIELGLEDNTATLSRFDPVEGKGERIRSWEIDPTVDPGAVLSPDGSRFATIGGIEGAASILLKDVRTGEVLREIAVEWIQGIGLQSVVWSPDGDGFYVAADTGRGAAILRVDLRGRTTVLIEDPTADFSSPRPSPDGRHLAFGHSIWDTNVWMIEDY